MSKDSYKAKYFKELNSLRFIGFIGIFFGHVFFSNSPEIINSKLYATVFNYGKILGFISIDSFFVLSSFLITWKALEEIKFTKKFQFKNFLIRRSLRIWPLYFFIVFIGFLLEYLKSHYFFESEKLPSLWNFVLFILNYDIIENGYNFLFFMVFMWSISVEEQFYIFWAITIKWFNKYLSEISFLIIFISLFFRIYFINDSLSLNFHTASALGNFGIGALTAILAFKHQYFLDKLKSLSRNKILFIYVTIFTFFILMPVLLENDFFIIIQRVLFSIFFSFIILEQTYCGNSIIKVSRIRYFNFFGKLSYGLYCYHGIMITVVLQVNELFMESLIISLVLYPSLIFVSTLLVSYVSFRFYELKFLKLKYKFSFLSSN
ncbi:MAG: acyltransferase [Flavobacteriales bacterium]